MLGVLQRAALKNKSEKEIVPRRNKSVSKKHSKAADEKYIFIWIENSPMASKMNFHIDFLFSAFHAYLLL